MAKNNNLSDFLKDLADTIRAKTGKTSLINPQDFSNEINTLGTVNNQSKAIEITSNGTINVSPDSGYTGLNNVVINTNVTTYDVEFELKDNTTFNIDNRGNISKIVFREGITTIADQALMPPTFDKNDSTYRHSEITINLPSTLTTIGKNAFTGLNIQNPISLPSGVSSIGDNAFSDCHMNNGEDGSNHEIYYVTFQGNVPSWSGNKDKNPFYDFYGGIKFGKNCQIIGDYAFKEIGGVSIDWESFANSNIKLIGQEAFSGLSRGADVLVLPASVEANFLRIKAGAFSKTKIGKYESSEWILDLSKSHARVILDYPYEFLPCKGSEAGYLDSNKYKPTWDIDGLKSIYVSGPVKWWETSYPWNDIYKDYIIDVTVDTPAPGEGGGGDEGGESTGTSTTAAPDSGTSE